MIKSPFTRTSMIPGCFAFVSPDDPLCSELDLPESAESIRLAGYDGIPLFVLFYKKELLTLDPYEVLRMIAQDRISFPSNSCKEDFVTMLGEHLKSFDNANHRIKKLTRIALIAGSAAVSLSAIALGIAALVNRKR